MKSISKPIRLILAVALFITLGLMTLRLYSYYSSVKVDWGKTKDVFDVIQNLATTLAVLIGAIWAYFNFFKGRTYRSRLEPKVSGKLISRDGANFLIVTAQLKNIGLSDVRITQKGSALRVLAYTSGERASNARNVEQTRLITLSVFEDHGWIESGKLIDDQRLIAIPDVEYVALQLRLRLVSDQIEWNSAAIIEPPELTSNSSTQFKPEETKHPLPEGEILKLEDEKANVNDAVGSTQDLAKITMEKEEDARESQKIEAEKTFEQTITVEPQVPKEEEQKESNPQVSRGSK